MWRKSSVAGLVAGGALIFAGVGAYIDFNHQVGERIRTGRQVEADVVALGQWGSQRFGGRQELTVSYSVAGEKYGARLMPVWEADRYPKSVSRLVVYLDKGNPRKLATENGFISEDKWVLGPEVLLASGILVVAIALLRRLGLGNSRPRSVSIGNVTKPIEVEFSIVSRGFETSAVENLVRIAVEALESRDASQRWNVAELLRNAELPIVSRGYDRMQVDSFIRQCLRDFGVR